MKKKEIDQRNKAKRELFRCRLAVVLGIFEIDSKVEKAIALYLK